MFTWPDWNQAFLQKCINYNVIYLQVVFTPAAQFVSDCMVPLEYKIRVWEKTVVFVKYLKGEDIQNAVPISMWFINFLWTNRKSYCLMGCVDLNLITLKREINSYLPHPHCVIFRKCEWYSCCWFGYFWGLWDKMEADISLQKKFKG